MKETFLLAFLIVIISTSLSTSTSEANSAPIGREKLHNSSSSRVPSDFKQESPPVLIWFGATQTGKSSCIKLLTGNSSIICGTPGRGGSTTSEINIYKEISPKLNKSYLHMDTMGFGDTRLDLTDTNIRNKVEMEIIRSSDKGADIQIKAIILTESLYGDSQQLSKNLLQISNIMGYLPSESIVILGTKSSAIIYEDMIAEREDYVFQVIKKFNISTGKYLRFATPFKYLNESSIDPTQFLKLGQIIESCAPVQMDSIRKKQERIREMTKAIQTKNAKSVEVEVTEERVDYSNKTEVQTKYIPYTYETCLFFGLLCRMNNVQVPDERQRNIKVPYTFSQ